jgi:hypothetical protein
MLSRWDETARWLSESIVPEIKEPFSSRAL